MTDDEPITLAEACELYPRAKLTVSTLRAEASRGTLDIFKLGKRLYTTPAALRAMVRKCQENARRQGSIWTNGEKAGSSETERASSARAALKTTLERLKKHSKPTLVVSTDRSHRQHR